MKEEEIQKLRDKYPIPIDEICLYSSFFQILGKRKERWRRMMSFDKNMSKYWSDTSECTGCVYLNEKESWCDLQGLPCTYNPILTPSTSMIGMACCGIGKVERAPKLFDL